MNHAYPTKPAVSIVIPTCNASGTIAETLAAVFAQTQTDFEVIVVNDGSSGNPACQAALARWQDRIRLLTQPRQGVAAARNLGIVHARARLLAFLDADDVWLPELLERHLSLLRARPEIDMVWSDGWIVGDTPLAGRTFLESSGMRAAPSFLSLMRQACAVLTSSVVVRTSVVRAAGGFDVCRPCGQEFDLWLRIAHRGAVMAVRTEPLVRRRIRAGAPGNEAGELRCAIAVLRGALARLPLDRAERAAVESRVDTLVTQLELELAKAALRVGLVANAREHLARARSNAWKVRAAAIGLRLAPDLLRRVYLLSRGRSAVGHDALPA